MLSCPALIIKNPVTCLASTVNHLAKNPAADNDYGGGAKMKPKKKMELQNM
jgi:hypothetical protein